jgi:hypothetical protein
MQDCNKKLVNAFPTALRKDALIAASVFPATSHQIEREISVRVGGDFVTIPIRLYHDPALINSAGLSNLHLELVHCLLTRHHDGVIREENLVRIVRSDHIWVPPFIILLVGEYVIEILSVIHNNLDLLKPSIYSEFLRTNPEFFAAIQQRIVSYWNCYYRSHAKATYVGFQLLDFFKSLVAQTAS